MKVYFVAQLELLPTIVALQTALDDAIVIARRENPEPQYFDLRTVVQTNALPPPGEGLIPEGINLLDVPQFGTVKQYLMLTVSDVRTNDATSQPRIKVVGSPLTIGVTGESMAATLTRVANDNNQNSNLCRLIIRQLTWTFAVPVLPPVAVTFTQGIVFGSNIEAIVEILN